MAEEYERVILVKPDVFIYRIPPRTTSRGYRASDWKLDEPDWTGRLRVVAKGRECILKLEDKSSGQLFAQCPVDKYPDAGKSAFIGIGFADRGDSFDLNVALQDHFKIIEKEENAEKADESLPKLDLKFKEGETIKVNLNIVKKSTSRPKAKNTGTGILLPPPSASSSSSCAPSVRSNSLTSSENLSCVVTSQAVTSGHKSLEEEDVSDVLNELSVVDKQSEWSSSSGTSAASGWAQF